MKWSNIDSYAQPVYKAEDNFLYLVANIYSDTK